MPGIEYGIVAEAEDILSAEWRNSALHLISTLYNQYSIDLHSLSGFKTLRHGRFDYCLCLEHDEELFAYIFDRHTRKLELVTQPNYQTLFYIIAWCLPERESSCKDPKKQENINFARGALPLLLPLMYKEAKTLIDNSILVKDEKRTTIKQARKK